MEPENPGVGVYRDEKLLWAALPKVRELRQRYAKVAVADRGAIYVWFGGAITALQGASEVIETLRRPPRSRPRRAACARRRP